jgi:hypothetical protein
MVNNTNTRTIIGIDAHLSTGLWPSNAVIREEIVHSSKHALSCGDIYSNRCTAMPLYTNLYTNIIPRKFDSLFSLI